MYYLIKEEIFHCLSGIIQRVKDINPLPLQSGDQVSGHTKKVLEGISQTFSLSLQN